jgi:hypothetical protein
MRAILILLALMLAACSGADQAATAAGSGELPAAEGIPEDDGKIACALGGSTEFVRDCKIERVEQEGRLSLVVRHPDGGFRRFDVLTDGRGVAVADGAEQAETALVGSELEVVVGADAYRFPATRKPATKGNAAEK